MSDWNITKPGDDDIVSEFPANERAARAAVKTNFGVDHFEDPADDDIGRHKQVTLVPGTAPVHITDRGQVFADADGNLAYRNADGDIVQLTNGTVPGGDGPVPLFTQASTPVPIAGGLLYTKAFEGFPELYFLDSEDNEIRLTYRGELAINLSTTDLTVGSLRTNTFMRGTTTDVAIVAGVATIDWEDGTVYRLTVTENIDLEFINMPDTASGEEQTIYIDVTDGGNFVIDFISDFTIEWPGRVVPALTVDGRDYVIAATNNGTTITAVALLDIGVPA